MPKRYRKYSKKLKRYRRKKRYRRRKRRWGKMSYNRISTLMAPDSMYVRLKYYQAAPNTGAGTGGFLYRGNSVFDPNASVGTSLQPAGFDEYARIYSHYQVFGSRMKVQFTNLSTNPIRVVVIPTIASTNPGINSAFENPYSKTGVIGSVNGIGNKTLVNYMSTKKLYGRGVQSINYTAPVGSNPSSQWYWHIRLASLDLTDINVDGNIEVIYYVKFWQRNLLTDA